MMPLWERYEIGVVERDIAKQVVPRPIHLWVVRERYVV
jgi:hypothetical protein